MTRSDEDHTPPEGKDARDALEALRRTAVHYGLWHAEAVRQLGHDAAAQAEAEAGDLYFASLFRRLGKNMGLALDDDGLPAALTALTSDQLEALNDALAVNWLAADGVWFQAIEKRLTMHDAKRVNDACWTQFAPYEAMRIKTLLKLPERGGLPALAAALAHRLYARVNEWDIVEESAEGFTFRMRACRVQTARTRKGMEEYPCKSGGIAEYRSFARAIDARIETTCVVCPPDPHPEDCVCAWRFTVRNGTSDADG